jgi:excisionase family DNA binding protein
MGGVSAAIGQLRDGQPTVGVPEACQLLGISRSHGYQAVKRGVFPAKVLKIGGSYRVVAASLARVLEGVEGAA